MTLMDMRRRAMMGAGRVPRLPAEYQEVEWIGRMSSGTQCIGTGLSFPNVDALKIKASFTDVSSSQYIAGVRDIGNTAIGFGVCFSNHGGLTYYPGLWRQNDIAYPVKVGEIFTVFTKFSATDGFFSVNGTIRDRFNVDEIVSSKTIFLFTLNGNGAEYPMKGKIYEAEAYLNNVLIRSFVPCYRKYDSVIGMYDLCGSIHSGTGTPFYTNGGQGDFTKGADVL